jgi:phosphoglycolate phosphatase
MHALLFDKDGTLLDFGASWSRAYRDLSLELCEGDSEAASAMLVAGGMDIATGLCRAGSVLAAGNTRDIATFWYPALANEPLAELIEHIDKVFYENGIRYSQTLPGVEETLAELQQAGFAMGVATSDGTAATKAALAKLDLDRYLPHVFGYDSVERPKPAADIVHAFAAAIGREPTDVVVIGDNVHDLEMARNAGAAAAIGVLSGTSGAADLKPYADALLDSICDLPGWLRSRAPQA